jgi:hypothetical protein
MVQAKSTSSTKSGSKPRVTKSKSQASRSKNTNPSTKKITEDDIRKRAHEIYLARGGTPGFEMDDWLMAKMELSQQGKE